MNQNSWPSLVFHWIFILFLLAPLAVLVAVAFTPHGYLSIPTSGLSLRWFHQIFENQQFVDSLVFSILLAACAATLALLVMLPTSLAIARSHFAGARALEAFFLSPLMIPSIVLGIAECERVAREEARAQTELLRSIDREQVRNHGHDRRE